MIALLLMLLQATPALVDNAYVRAVRNAAPCASAQAACGRRVLVALGPLTLAQTGHPARTLSRGDIAVFAPAESYDVHGDAFVEVVIKATHPAATRPPSYVHAEKNRRLYDSNDLFIFEEQLAPGDTRPRHGHAERLVIVVNDTRLQQWQDDGQEVFKNQVPDNVHFNQPVAHKVVNVGRQPLRNIVIEFKPPSER
ncbi:MAG: hypothetical protein ACRENC_18985 [Gemmatimonadaceae bacterium]